MYKEPCSNGSLLNVVCTAGFLHTGSADFSLIPEVLYVITKFAFGWQLSVITVKFDKNVFIIFFVSNKNVFNAEEM